MTYLLLTGSTGFLGSFVMRDLLRLGVPLAVLARGTRRESPADRIENRLAFWEARGGYSLPRPVVLAGDITEPLLGLDSTDRRWLRSHCGSILHSAASLTFHEKDNEPWRTNVEGVRHILELCRDCAIEHLVHVSTAYTCGLRTGRVLETELQVGQEFGNDYEQSKVQAEELIRSDEHLRTFTIFRPSIIVGESRTGFTTAYNGFYMPLRVLAWLRTQMSLEDVSQMDVMGLLGLEGSEGKNLVPVDWVSDALVTILRRQPANRVTYSLASPTSVRADTMQRIFLQALREFTSPTPSVANGRQRRSLSLDIGAEGNSALEKIILEQFLAYQSYWRNDPEFDARNTQSAIPDKPCPSLTDDDLLRLCRYALEMRFVSSRFAREASGASPREHVYRGLRQGQLTEEANGHAFCLHVTGPGGGAWTVHLDGGATFSYVEGRISSAAEARLNHATFQALVDGRCTVEAAVASGQIVLRGAPCQRQIVRFFQLCGDQD